MRWDDAVKIVLGTKLEDIEAKKREAREKSGDFTEVEEDEDSDE